MKVNQGDAHLSCNFNATRLSLLALCCIVSKLETVLMLGAGFSSVAE